MLTANVELLENQKITGTGAKDSRGGKTGYTRRTAMTNEEALDLLEHGDWFQAVYNNLPERTADKIAEAINTVAKTVRFNFTDGPLTLDQLREMDGKPVWVKCLNSKKYTDPPIGWRIVERSITGTIGVWNGESCFAERDYGVDWLAYAYPPAQINQEVWKPCEFCSIEMNCTNCDNADRPTNMEPCASCRLTSNGKTNWKYSKTLYCRVCGRPLTEEAWVMLEKRLRG